MLYNEILKRCELKKIPYIINEAKKKLRDNENKTWQ